MILTGRQVAPILRVTHEYISSLVVGGIMPHQKIGKVRRLVEADVCKWLISRRVSSIRDVDKPTFDKLRAEQYTGAGDWLTTEEAQVFMVISRPTLFRHRSNNEIPFYKLSTNVLRYRKRELLELGWGE